MAAGEVVAYACNSDSRWNKIFRYPRIEYDPLMEGRSGGVEFDY
jgi:hypothetical protein